MRKNIYEKIKHIINKHRAKKAPVNNRTYAPCFQFCSFYKTGGAARYFRNKNEQLRQRTFTPPFSDEFFLYVYFIKYTQKF